MKHLDTSQPSHASHSSHPFQVARRAAILIFLTIATLCFGQSVFAQTGYTGIFGGGPFYKNASANITEIKNSGFTEAIVWSVEVNSVGDLNLNGEFPLTSGGVYIGDQTHSDFASNMALLKTGTVKRITFSIGSSNVGDFQDIKALVNAQGTGPTSILYKDFAALKAAIPSLDAVDLDDENSFDSASTISFGVMLGGLGYHVAPDAFSNSGYWTNVVTQINAQAPGTVDGVHLQAYAGGSGNNPCVGWNFGTVPVWPGLWDANDTPTQVQTTMTGWHSQCGITGGFMWLYDDFVGNGKAAQYASAINNAVSSTGFTLAGPATVFANQNATTNAAVTVTDFGGFNGSVVLTVSTLPKGVKATITGQGTNNQTIAFKATSTATTGFTTVTVTGTSGTIKSTISLSLAVSAAVGKTGTGTPVDLTSALNLYGIYTDGSSYTTGGLDGGGYSYSSNLLTPSRVYNGALFNFGPTNGPSAVGSSGQTISMTGSHTSLMLLATGVQGKQLSQVFTVNYTDGTSTKFTQSLSDWFTAGKYTGETEGVASAYRNFDNGTKDNRTFNLYSYKFALNSAKTVQSLTLPNNSHVVVLAVTLVP